MCACVDSNRRVDESTCGGIEHDDGDGIRKISGVDIALCGVSRKCKSSNILQCTGPRLSRKIDLKIIISYCIGHIHTAATGIGDGDIDIVSVTHSTYIFRKIRAGAGIAKVRDRMLIGAIMCLNFDRIGWSINAIKYKQGYL